MRVLGFGWRGGVGLVILGSGEVCLLLDAWMNVSRCME